MKRFLCLILTGILVLPLLLTSCGDAGSSGPAETTAQTAAAESETVTTEPPFSDGLPDTDLGGYEINFIGKGAQFGAFEVYDVYVEAETGDLLKDAIFKRNRTIEEKYNFTIKFTPVEGSIMGGTRPGEIVHKLILSGDDTYDVIYDGTTKLSPLAESGELYDLYQVPNLDFDRPWWNADMNSRFSIMNKLYYTCGSAMLGPYDGLYCILFNKKLVEDYGMGNLYEFVDNNNWTLDKFASLLADKAVDLNGDGVIGEGDIQPYFTETYSFYTFMVGAGVTTSEKDDKDVPHITVNNERTARAVDEVLKFIGDEKAVTYIEDLMSAKGNDYGLSYYVTGFTNNEFIFREGAMMEIPQLRNMDANFGILPMPKLDDKQDEYYHTFSVWNAAMMSIPINVRNIDKVGFILEAMAAESYHSVMPEYIERQLKGKLLRDNESEDVLKIILNTMTVDVVDTFSWAPMVSIYQTLAKDRTNKFASTYASREKSFQENLNKVLETYSAIN